MRIVLAIAATLALAAPLAAQTGQPDTEGGRFILRQVDDGFLRVDRESGDTSLCRPAAGSWACTAVADDREVLEEEIARLSQENAELARRIAELQAEAPDAAAPEPDALVPETEPETSERDFTLDLPTGDEIDSMMQTFETMMRRFLEMVRSLKQDLESNPPAEDRDPA